MYSLFIGEDTNRIECVWINYSACFFVYVVSQVLPTKPLFDLCNVSCNDWFTSQKWQNLPAKCVNII